MRRAVAESRRSLARCYRKARRVSAMSVVRQFVSSTPRPTSLSSTSAIMSAQVAAASPVHAPKKSPKKASKPKSAKVVASHPTYSVMIKAALVALKDHKGSSRAAILKYILQHYKVGDNINKANCLKLFHRITISAQIFRCLFYIKCFLTFFKVWNLIICGVSSRKEDF